MKAFYCEAVWVQASADKLEQPRSINTRTYSFVNRF